jgi:hypothetical protein
MLLSKHSFFGKVKSIEHVNRALVCFVLLFTISGNTNAALLKNDQLIALVDGTLAPLIKSYIPATNNIAFDVVLIKDAGLRKELSKKYAKISKWLAFESENDLAFISNYGGGENVDKKTDKVVYVNRFEVLSSQRNKCTVRWSRELGSLCAFSKIVTLVFRDNKWGVAGITLETVS